MLNIEDLLLLVPLEHSQGASRGRQRGRREP